MPGTTSAAWHQSHIQNGELINGAWAVNVEQAGTFEISLYRWAPSMDKAMTRRMNGNEVKFIDH